MIKEGERDQKALKSCQRSLWMASQQIFRCSRQEAGNVRGCLIEVKGSKNTIPLYWIQLKSFLRCINALTPFYATFLAIFGNFQALYSFGIVCNQSRYKRIYLTKCPLTCQNVSLKRRKKCNVF